MTQAPTEGIRLDIDGVVARLLLDRPDRRNAITAAMWEAIPTLVAQAEATPGVRVIVVGSSTSGVFSAGADIGEYRDSIGDTDARARRPGPAAAGALQRAGQRRRCTRPVLGLVS